MMKKNDSTKWKAILTGILILTAYGVLVDLFTDSKSLVLIADILSGISVIGIAIILFPFFKLSSKSLSIAYILLKLIEGLLMIAGGIIFIYNPGIRDWLYDSIHLYTFILGGFILYVLLYKTKLIPGFISIWGLVAIFFLTISTVLKLFGLSYPVLDTFLILIVSNEVFLAIWLMIKGFELKHIFKSDLD